MDTLTSAFDAAFTDRYAIVWMAAFTTISVVLIITGDAPAAFAAACVTALCAPAARRHRAR